MYTTSVTFVNAVYDLMAHPKYIDLLREEIDRVYQDHRKWDKTAVVKLKLMDSAKESSRLHSATMCKYSIICLPLAQSPILWNQDRDKRICFVRKLRLIAKQCPSIV